MAAEFTPDPGEGTGLDEAIAAYLAACEVEGKTRRTVQAYAETLRRFRAIYAAEGLPDRVAAFRPAHIYAFLKVIADGGVSLGTRHRRFGETRAFFSWCTRMGACVRNPFTGIPNVKVEQKVIQPLTEGEIQSLLDVCDPATEFGCRNRAIILLFLDTGSVRSQTTKGVQRGAPRDRRSLRGGPPRHQCPPACDEEPALLGQGDRLASSPASAEVLSQLIER